MASLQVASDATRSRRARRRLRSRSVRTGVCATTTWCGRRRSWPRAPAQRRPLPGRCRPTDRRQDRGAGLARSRRGFRWWEQLQRHHGCRSRRADRLSSVTVSSGSLNASTPRISARGWTSVSTRPRSALSVFCAARLVQQEFARRPCLFGVAAGLSGSGPAAQVAEPVLRGPPNALSGHTVHSTMPCSPLPAATAALNISCTFVWRCNRDTVVASSRFAALQIGVRLSQLRRCTGVAGMHCGMCQGGAGLMGRASSTTELIFRRCTRGTDHQTPVDVLR